MTTLDSTRRHSDLQATQHESFHNGFFCFVKALNLLSKDATSQCDPKGGANVAQEIKRQMLAAGTLLPEWRVHLTALEHDRIASLVAAVSALPPAALVANQDAMRHSAWACPRRDAAQLLVRLEEAIERNRTFLAGA